jgi:hypothetical protein
MSAACPPHPACFLFLVDQSGSMADRLSGSKESKAKLVASWLNHELSSLTMRAVSVDRVKDWCYIGVVGYGASVRSAFEGNLAGKYLVKTSEAAESPARVVPRMRRELGPDGQLVDMPFHVPIWIEPRSDGGTPMVAALETAEKILSEWVERNPLSFPPIVVNITDGQAADGDPFPVMERIRQIRTQDGSVLFFNTYLSDLVKLPIEWAASEQDLPGPYTRQLFRASSPLPDTLQEWLKVWGSPAPASGSLVLVITVASCRHSSWQWSAGAGT